jgi:hypothetical protein
MQNNFILLVVSSNPLHKHVNQGGNKGSHAEVFGIVIAFKFHKKDRYPEKTPDTTIVMSLLNMM